jgi:glutamine phosphoribosylpyrophosphate amidotransferase
VTSRRRSTTASPCCSTAARTRAGIATIDGSRVQLHKGNGLVADVFETADVQLLTGRVGIGHCRYPTAGFLRLGRGAALST